MEDQEPNYIVSKVRLKDSDKGGEFRPFIIDYKSNPSLRTIVKAFANSGEIKVGYSTIIKGKGIQHPTLKRKSLYLTGGSLRDHLKNQTVVEYDCATDASPDEIRMILSTEAADLKEVKPLIEDIEILSKYKSLPEIEGKKKVFFASRWDSEGHEMEFTVMVDSQKIFISTFNKNTKNRMLIPKKRVFATTPEEDAQSRDLTINALYLALKNDEGENTELIDPLGGIFDLKNGKIVLISEREQPFEKDPYLPYRIANLSARYAFDKKIPADINEKIRNYDHSNYDEDKKVLKRYYISAVENINIPTQDYINNLIHSHLVKHIFPDCVIEHPTADLTNNRILATGYILQKNMAGHVANVLEKMGWSKHDIENITKFIKLAQFCRGNFINPSLLYDFFAKPFTMPNSTIKTFLQIMNCSEIYDKIFTHDFTNVMRKYVDYQGSREVNPLYTKFLGRVPRTDEFEDIRKKLFDAEVKKIV
jgi:hypothetical protein